MEISEIKKLFARTAKVPQDEVLMEFSPEHPECLMVVILRDVGPSRIHDAFDSLASSKACQRAIVNVVDKKDADVVRSENRKGVREAIKKSWDVNVATVRWG